jgi:hypothetical protein
VEFVIFQDIELVLLWSGTPLDVSVSRQMVSSFNEAAIRGDFDFQDRYYPVELGPIHSLAYLSEDYTGANQTRKLRSPVIPLRIVGDPRVDLPVSFRVLFFLINLN